MRMLTLRKQGESLHWQGSNQQTHLSDPPGSWRRHVRTVIRATWETRAVRNLNARRWRAKRESDRRMVPSKPGNSGGGKAPDFWHAFEEGKDRGLAMSLETPEKIRSLQRKLILATRYRTALLERMSKRRRSRSSASTFCTTRSTAKTFSNTLTNSPRGTAARRAWTGSHSHRSRRQGFKSGYPAYGRTCGTNHSQCDG